MKKWYGYKRNAGKGVGQALRLSKARLDELVEEALVDAYGESEQVTGFYTMMENDLRLPFETKILGMTVIVEGENILRDHLAQERRCRLRKSLPSWDTKLINPSERDSRNCVARSPPNTNC